MVEKKEENRCLAYVILMIATVGLLSEKLMLLSGIIILMVDVYLVFKGKHSVYKNIFILLFSIILYTIIQCIFIEYTAETFKTIIKCCIYFCIVFAASNINIDNKAYELSWVICLGFCLLIQIIQFFDLFPITEYLVRFYGHNEDSTVINVLQYDTLNSFRSGSIFIAINPYFKLILGVWVISLCSKLMISRSDSGDNARIAVVGLLLSIVSAIFVGSRTCMIIMIITAGIYLWSYFRLIKATKKTIASWISILIIAIITLLFFWKKIINALGISDYRVFTLFIGSGGQTGSLEYKIDMLRVFLSQSNVTELIFGKGLYEIGSAGLMMDSDIGWFLSYYGLVGIVFFATIIVCFYKVTLCRYPKPVFSVMCCLCVALSGLTSGVFFNVRVFGTLLVLFFVRIRSFFPSSAPSVQRRSKQSPS